MSIYLLVLIQFSCISIKRLPRRRSIFASFGNMRITRSLRLNSWFTLSRLLEVLRRILQASGSWEYCYYVVKASIEDFNGFGSMFFQTVQKCFFSLPCFFKFRTVVYVLQTKIDLSMCILGHLVQNIPGELSLTALPACPLKLLSDCPNQTFMLVGSD